MIKIERLREKEKCKLCNKDSIYKLTFSTYDSGATISSGIILCENCVQELKQAINIDYKKTILIDKYIDMLKQYYNYSDRKLNKIKDYALKNFDTEHSIFTGEVKNHNCEAYVNFEKEQLLFYVDDKLKNIEQFHLNEDNEMFISINVDRIKRNLEMIIELY